MVFQKNCLFGTPELPPGYYACGYARTADGKIGFFDIFGKFYHTGLDMKRRVCYSGGRFSGFGCSTQCGVIAACMVVMGEKVLSGCLVILADGLVVVCRIVLSQSPAALADGFLMNERHECCCLGSNWNCRSIGSVIVVGSHLFCKAATTPAAQMKRLINAGKNPFLSFINHTPKGMSIMDKILTKSEVAKYLQISERKLDYLRQAGELPCIKIGRSVRFRLEDVEAFLENRLTVSTETKSPLAFTEPMGECRFRHSNNQPLTTKGV